MIELTEEEIRMFEEADKEWDKADEWAKTHKFTKEEKEEMEAFQERCNAESWGMIYGCEQAIKKRKELEKSKDTGTTK